MKPIPKVMLMTVALALVLAVWAGRTRAEEAKSIPSPDALLKIMAEAGKPGPEHRKLEPFVGNWTVSVKLWTAPGQPPAEVKGTAERRWIMGGRFVQETVKGECDGKSFEGLGLLGYDNTAKKFTTVKACGLCGTIANRLSTCDASGSKFTCATEECCPLSGQKVNGRDETIIESNDRIVTNVFKTIDGKELKVMEIVSIRQD
jgi:hypothetical protein